jgi:hypothetical protein
MKPEDRPVSRSDSFEVLAPDGPELTDEEAAWPVASVRARADSFEVSHPEVVVRVPCDATATPAEVAALAERIRAAVEGARGPAGTALPVQILVPDTGR